MNKKTVNDMLSVAKEAIIKTEIAKNGKVISSFRGDISTFGACVVIGSLPATVASYSKQGNAEVERQKLVRALYYCVTGELKTDEEMDEIVTYFCENDCHELREKIKNASVAMKLAMNYFKLVKEWDK